jgi:hypothetical protein
MDFLGVKLVDDRVGHAQVAADYGGVLWSDPKTEQHTYILKAPLNTIGCSVMHQK